MFTRACLSVRCTRALHAFGKKVQVTWTEKETLLGLHVMVKSSCAYKYQQKLRRKVGGLGNFVYLDLSQITNFRVSDSHKHRSLRSSSL